MSPLLLYLFCRGKVDKSLSGMLPALTPLPLHTCSWPPKKQVPLQTRRNGEKWQSTSSWLLHTTLYQWPLSLWVSLNPRHMPSSASLAVASRRKQGNPYPSTTYIRELRWPSSGGTQPRCWARTSPPRDTDPIFIG